MLVDKEKNTTRYLRLLAINEIRAARKIYAFLNQQAKRLEKAYLESGSQAVDEVINNDNTEIAKLLIDHYNTVINRFAKETFSQLGYRKTNFETLVQEYALSEGLKKSKLIGKATRQWVKGIVENGIKEGAGTEKIAKNIRDRVGGAVGRARSRTIARTETHNAATYGQLESARETELSLVKEWVTVEDERTRDGTESEYDHAAANGQQVELDGFFDVSGERISRPGEGSPGNAINCRCTMIFIPKNTEII